MNNLSRAQVRKDNRFHRESKEIQRAIFASHCSYCGAKPGELCKVKPTSRILPDELTTSTSHMARVRAGRALWNGQAQLEIKF